MSAMPDFWLTLAQIILINLAFSGDNAVVIGLGASIPLIIFGSTVILKLMGRLPFIITMGAALLGWVAGEMAISDLAINEWATRNHSMYLLPFVLCALFVVTAGKRLQMMAAS